MRNANWIRLTVAWKLAVRGDWASLAARAGSLLRRRTGRRIAPAVVEAGGPHDETFAQELWPEDRPLISVVIPCFNYGDFITEAVDSVLGQTFQDFEIIVVEGGSTCARTREIVAALQRPKTHVFMREGSHRAGANRNFGIERARGKYICCLDADDRLKPTYLEKAAFLLESHGYDLVSTAIQCFGYRNDIISVLRDPDLRDMLEGNHVATCAVFRRSLWERAGGYRDIGSGKNYLYEDWGFWIRLSALGARFFNTGEALFLYRRHRQDSLSNKPGVLPPEQQRRLIAEANRDLIDAGALRRSRKARRKRLRAVNGLINLGRGGTGGGRGSTILLAMPFLILGGAERLLSQVVRHLVAEGHRVIVTTTIDPGDEAGSTTPWFEEATPEIYHLPRFLDPRHWRGFIDYLVVSKQVDIILIAGSDVYYRLLPWLKQRHPALRAADLLFNTVGHTANNRKFSSFIDMTLTENRQVVDWLRSAGESPDRIRMIPSGIDLAHFTPMPKPRATIESLDLRPGDFVIGYSGRLSQEKAPLTFLKIAATVDKDASVVFVMTGAGPLAGAVRRQQRRRRVGGRFRFAGSVGDVRDYLACYDVLVLPSVLDGRPLVVLEALAMGIPVVASRVGGLPDLIEHGVNGFLCEPGNVQDFVDKIEWLVHHPDKYYEMRRAARAFAEQKLDAIRMNNMYQRAFKDVIMRGNFRTAFEFTPPIQAKGGAITP